MRAKKILSIFVFLTTVFWSTNFELPRVEAATYEEGSLLMSNKGASTIYYIGPDGGKYVFPEAKTYATWFDDFKGVKKVDSSILDQYPDSGIMPVKEGIKLITHRNTAKIYAVEPGGIARWIPSEKIAKELFGNNWVSRVIDVLPGFFATTYSIGDDLSNTLPNGSVVTYGGKYYYIENGQKRLMSKEALRLNNIKESQAIKVGSLSKYKDGDLVNKMEKRLSAFLPKLTIEDKKIEVCHYPGGDKDQAHTINISKNALSTHLKNGDTLGECTEGKDGLDDNTSQDIEPGAWCSVLLGLFNSGPLGYSSNSPHSLLDLNNDGSINLMDNTLATSLYNTGDSQTCLSYINGEYSSVDYRNLDWCNGVLQGLSDNLNSSNPNHIFDLDNNGLIDLTDVVLVSREYYQADQALCYQNYLPDLPAMNDVVDYDEDNDGYNSTVGGGTDCNDNNNMVNPGVNEISDNNIDDNCNGQIDEIAIVPGADTIAPTTPINLSATATGTQISLSWTAATDNVGISQYQIERSTAANSGFSQIATSNSNSYLDTGLNSNTTYYYRVRAVDTAGNISAYSSVANASTPSGNTPPPIEGYPIVNSISGSVSNDQILTIFGSNFGIKAQAAPVMWDTVDNQPAYANLSDGQVIPTGNAYPWEDNGRYGNDTMYTTSRPQRGFRSAHYYFPVKGMLTGHDLGGAEVDKFYATWWIKPSHDISHGPGGSASTKLIRVWEDGSGGDNARLSWTGEQFGFSPGYGQPSYGGWPGWRGQSNQWNRVEIYIDSTNNIYQPTTNGELIYNPTTWQSVPGHPLNKIWVIGLDPSYPENLDPNMMVDFGEIYVDTTPSRVEICTGSSWSNRGHCEIQIPQSWSNSNTQVKINQGTLSNGQAAYLYLVNSNNQANSAGYSINFN